MLTEIDDCVTQLFVGVRPTTGDDPCTCTECTRTLREGEQITVYATRPGDAGAWRLNDLYCRDCAPDAITSPTLGVTELLLQSQLARTMDVRTQQGFQTLLTVRTVTTSPPTEGSAERRQDVRTHPETASVTGTGARADPHAWQ